MRNWLVKVARYAYGSTDYIHLHYYTMTVLLYWTELYVVQSTSLHPASQTLGIGYLQVSSCLRVSDLSIPR